MDISFKNKYYYFNESKEVKSYPFYTQYINWIKGEFDLFQKEELDGLKVYLPNGCFTIKMINKKTDLINAEICVKSKSKKSGFITYQKIELLYNNLVKIYKIN